MVDNKDSSNTDDKKLASIEDKSVFLDFTEDDSNPEPTPEESIEEADFNTNINNFILAKNDAYSSMLIVDDEESIHTLTELSLKHEKFSGKPLKFLHATSGKMACEVIAANPDIAVILLDVVMETKDAGLKVVDFIRKELKNNIVRIILRTGQPGDAPERDIISKYGINDYKEKTELTADKLYTAIYSAIREYNNMVKVLQLRHEIELLNVFLSQLINYMPSALIAIDLEHKITHWNSETNKYMAHGVKLNKGLDLYSTFPMLTKCKDFIEKSIAYNTITTQDSVEIETSTGSISFFDLVTYPLIDNNKHYIGYVIRLDDVTQQVQYREQIMQTKKLISVGAMAAGIAHEIKNPLSVILNSSSNINRRLSPDIEKNRQTAAELNCDLTIIYKYLTERKVIEFVSNITEAGNKIGTIVTNMLDYCRGSANATPKKVSIDSMITKTLLLTKMDKEMHDRYKFNTVEIVENLPADFPEVLCHETEIEQVLYNLVRNSIQAMGDKLDNRKIEFVAKIEDGFVRLECIDNGPGIKPEHIKDVFSPLFSTKGDEGNGLGLSICKEIMEKHKGDLVCESEFGKYTKFTLILPLPEK